MIDREFQPPKSWDDFENLCCDLWKVEWNCLSMQPNGRQSQNQHGVDCYGKQKFSNGWTGIQCKRRQTYPENKLTFREVLEEVDAAKGFQPALEHLIVATTFRRCSKLQAQVRKLSDELELDGHFSVSVAFWDDIEKLLNKNSIVAKEYYKDYYTELSDEERKLFLIKNPTKIELLGVETKSWLGDSKNYLTFNLKNVSEMPASKVSLRIFKRKENDIIFNNSSVNSFCFINGLKIDAGHNLDYPLISIEELKEQFPIEFMSKKIIGVGLEPTVPEALKNAIINETLKQVEHLGNCSFYHSFSTFPIFVKYEYSSPFSTEIKTIIGAYIYFMDI
ncbi:TPA: hypothetical protein KD866_000839 [Vibrio parahaemolyticus]|nr:hypothetical protein [Vibrio parahaemolyticus]